MQLTLGDKNLQGDQLSRRQSKEAFQHSHHPDSCHLDPQIHVQVTQYFRMGVAATLCCHMDEELAPGSGSGVGGQRKDPRMAAHQCSRREMMRKKEVDDWPLLLAVGLSCNTLGCVRMRETKLSMKVRR